MNTVYIALIGDIKESRCLENSHDKKFAEYYLLGTLLSTIIAIVTALLI